MDKVICNSCGGLVEDAFAQLDNEQDNKTCSACHIAAVRGETGDVLSFNEMLGKLRGEEPSKPDDEGGTISFGGFGDDDETP